MGKDVPEVNLLGSDNYWEWALRVRDLLTYKGVIGALYIDPAALLDAQAYAADQMALAIIRSHVSASMLPYLMSVRTAREAWETLTQLQGQTLGAKRSLLEEQLLHLHKLPTEDMTEYCARAQKCRQELELVGEPCSENRLIRAILRGLPAAFESVRELLTFQDVSLVAVMTQLKIAEERINERQSEGMALMTSSQRKQRWMESVQCWNCGKKGHIARDCTEEPEKSDEIKPRAAIMI